jgi:hypothetical protein
LSAAVAVAVDVAFAVAFGSTLCSTSPREYRTKAIMKSSPNSNSGGQSLP